MKNEEKKKPAKDEGSFKTGDCYSFPDDIVNRCAWKIARDHEDCTYCWKKKELLLKGGELCKLSKTTAVKMKKKL